MPLRRHSGAALLIAAACAAPVHPARAADTHESQLKTVRHVELRPASGRLHVPRRELRDVMKTRGTGIWPWSDRPPLRRDFLFADTAGIAAVYRQHGFLDVQVSDSVESVPGTRTVDVEFLVREGARSHIASVAFEGLQVVRENDVRRPLFARAGRPFDPAYLIADTTIISRAYQERGYLPHVVGGAARDSLNPLRIHVVYMVHEGPRYHVGQSYVIRPGEVHVAERLVRRELLMKPGAVYDIRKVEDAQQHLYETGLFSQVEITPLPDSSNTQMEFQVQLRERRPRWLDASIGSGSEERFQLTGEWGHRNLLGHGLEGLLQGRYSLDANGHFLLGRVEASMVEPWLFGFRNHAQPTVYFERHEFRDPDTLRVLTAADARGFSFEVRRDFGRLAHLTLIQDNTFVNQRQELVATLARPGDSLSQALADSLTETFVPSYATHRLQLTGERDRRDSPVQPSRGSLQDGSAEIAGGPFHATTHFTKYQGSSAWYTPLPLAGWVLATRARGGIIKPFGTNARVNPAGGIEDVGRVPIEDLFRLGGVNSVRGYNENDIAPSGGLVELLGNVELRIPVVGPFGLEVYVDAGNVWARPEYVTMGDFQLRPGQVLDSRDVRYVVGVGGRFNLPFGPLRLDFTQGVGHEPPPQPSLHRVQFAIGPSF